MITQKIIRRKMPTWMGSIDCEPLPLKDWTNLQIMPEYKLTIYVKQNMVVDNISKILSYKKKMEKIYEHVIVVII
jgi:hypothetical protein